MKSALLICAAVQLAACSDCRSEHEVARAEAWRSITEDETARSAVFQCLGNRFPSSVSELNEIQFNRNEESDYLVARYHVRGDGDRYALVLTEFYVEEIPLIWRGVGNGGGASVACCPSRLDDGDTSDEILCEHAQ